MVCIIAILICVFPNTSTQLIDTIRVFLNQYFSWYYIVFALAIVTILFYVACSKIGKIRLGHEDDKPINAFSWASMIFTSTMAADILFYSFHEWAYYYNETILLESTVEQSEKMLWSTSYPLFHWGIIPWSIYLLLAVIYGYMFYTHSKNKYPTISNACQPILNDKTNKWQGKLIDVVAIFTLLCGTSTTFSVTTPLMTSIVCKLLNIQQTPFISIVILCIIAILYSVAVLSRNGISIIAKITTILFSMLIAIFFMLGGPQYIIENGLQGLGNMLQNFICMSTWSDPTRQTSFPQTWTIFYWSYWIAWCIATPFFIAKISKGRTIRQTIFGGLIAGLCGTFMSFIALGGYGQNLLNTNEFNLPEKIANGMNITDCIVEMINTSNISTILFLLILLTMLFLYASTFDALTDVVSSFSCNASKKSIKIIWGTIFIVLPIALIFNTVATQTIMSISIIAAFPFSLILILIVVSFFKILRSK